MSRPAPPLRFLAFVLGAWIVGRAAMLLPDWIATRAGAIAAIAPAGAAAEPPSVASVSPIGRRPAVAADALVAAGRPQAVLSAPHFAISTVVPATSALVEQARTPGVASTDVLRSDAVPASASQVALPVSMPAATSITRPNPWSLSAWALLRRGSGAQLAPGGLLGGSQIGARLTYRLEHRLALSARAYAPLDRPAGAEVAFGLEWQPSRSVPIRLLAERRQAIGREGRSAFSLLAHGGLSEARLIGPLRLDAYAQGGAVGLRSGDLFADGSARIGLPLSERLLVGAAAWGAAQPGAARLDLGPEASYRLPGTTLRVSAGYRIRVVGDARPGSGPSLTLASDF